MTHRFNAWICLGLNPTRTRLLGTVEIDQPNNPLAWLTAQKRWPEEAKGVQWLDWKSPMTCCRVGNHRGQHYASCAEEEENPCT